MSRQNVVNAIPMDVIWDESSRVLDARRVEYVSADQIREYLRAGDVVIFVADIGSDLLRLSGRDMYAFWNNDAASRLVAPDAARHGFHLEDYPAQYCYLASRWERHDLTQTVLLFERYH